MTKLVIASQNRHKITEIEHKMQSLGLSGIELSGLAAYPNYQPPPEDGLSFKENALIKALAAAKMSGQIALADDSGLCVDILNGAPGIYSARYAGADQDDEANNRKLLADLAGLSPRDAHFYCSIIIAWPTGAYVEGCGQMIGRILESEQGEGGFGYDPLLYLPAYKCTVAQLPLEIKNQISHRAIALSEVLLKFKSKLEEE